MEKQDNHRPGLGYLLILRCFVVLMRIWGHLENCTSFRVVDREYCMPRLSIYCRCDVLSLDIIDTVWEKIASYSGEGGRWKVESGFRMWLGFQLHFRETLFWLRRILPESTEYDATQTFSKRAQRTVFLLTLNITKIYNQ